MATNYTISTVFAAIDKMSPVIKSASKNVAQYLHSIKEAKERAEKGSGIMNMAKGFLLGGVALEGLKELPEKFAAIAEKGEEIGRTASILGVTTDELQKFRYAAKMTDTSAESLEVALKKMNQGLGQLHKRTGPIAQGLAMIDRPLMETLRTAGSSQEAFLAVADAVQATSDPMKRAAIAVAVFGKSGQEMLPLLLKGKDGVEGLMEETKKYAGIMDGEAIAASEAYADAMKKTQGAMTSLQNAAITPLLQAIAPMLDDLVEWFNANKQIIKADIKGFVKGLTGALQVLGPILGMVVWILQTFGPALLAGATAMFVMNNALVLGKGAVEAYKFAMGVLNTVIAAFQLSAEAGTGAMGALNLMMDANPIGLIITAVAVLIGLIAFLWTNVDGFADGFMAFLGAIGRTFETVASMVLVPLLGLIDLVLTGLSLAGKALHLDTSMIDGAKVAIEATANNMTRDSWFGPGAPVASDAPVSPNAGTLARTEAITKSESKSKLEVDFKNLPQGTTVKQSGAANGITSNLGPAKKAAS